MVCAPVIVPTQMSRDQIVASVREEYSTNYFVSGVGEMTAYAEVR